MARHALDFLAQPHALAQLLLVGAPLGDVGHRGDPARDEARLVAHRHAAHLHPDVAAVGAQDAILLGRVVLAALALRPRAADEIAPARRHALAVFRVDQHLEVIGPLRGVGIGRAAADLAEARRVEHRVRPAVPVDDADLEGAHHELEAAALEGERLLHRAALAHVDARDEEADGAALRVAHHGARLHQAAAAEAELGELDRRARAALERVAVVGEDRVGLALRHHLVEALAEHLVALKT